MEEKMGFHRETWRKTWDFTMKNGEKWDFTILRDDDLMEGNGDISTQTSVDRGTMVHD